MSRRRFDVCNGDADGLCAVVQWRLHDPAPATLVTGLKREIALLERVPAGDGDEVLVCDLSMARNRAALDEILARGARVRYFDHHAVDEIPRHPGLEARIDLSSGTCTSLLVDRFLTGERGEARFRAWAAVGAWGDNMDPAAERLADAIGLPREARERLRALGVAINYNAYGDDESDLLIPPAELFRLMLRHADPLDFAAREPIADRIAERRERDLARAASLPFLWDGPTGRVLVLPDEAWARRVSGTLANALASEAPGRAHAVFTRRSDGTLWASVRAPLAAPNGADALCRQFGGAGRAAAGGIERMAPEDLGRFVEALAAMRWG